MVTTNQPKTAQPPQCTNIHRLSIRDYTIHNSLFQFASSHAISLWFTLRLSYEVMLSGFLLVEILTQLPIASCCLLPLRTKYSPSIPFSALDPRFSRLRCNTKQNRWATFRIHLLGASNPRTTIYIPLMLFSDIQRILLVSDFKFLLVVYFMTAKNNYITEWLTYGISHVWQFLVKREWISPLLCPSANWSHWRFQRTNIDETAVCLHGKNKALARLTLHRSARWPLSSSIALRKNIFYAEFRKTIEDYVFMTIEIHSSYNQFYSTVFWLLFMVRTNLVVHHQQHGILYCITQFGTIVLSGESSC